MGVGAVKIPVPFTPGNGRPPSHEKDNKFQGYRGIFNRSIKEVLYLDEKIKSKIISLRSTGTGYRRVAALLGISVDAVKHFCKLRGIAGYGGGVGKEDITINLRRTVVAKSKCVFCNKPIEVLNGGRVRKYCSPSCRKKAWIEKG